MLLLSMASRKTISSFFHPLKNSMHSYSNSNCYTYRSRSMSHIFTRYLSHFVPCAYDKRKELFMLPIYIAVRHKSRSGPRNLTIKPKLASAQPRGHARDGRDMRMKYDKIGSRFFNYSDDVEVSSDDFEELAHAITTYGDKYKGIEANDIFWRDMIAFQNLVRTKTLEQKYFRPPKKPNLLTWAAKEQMRSLYQNDPEEWNVEILAKTFPVGTESSQKIISSRIRLRRLQDILKHDLYVKRNWEIILMNLRANKIDSDNIMKDFISNLHNVNIIQNVLPVADLDRPKISKKSRKGVFSLIVQDALQKKDDENREWSEKVKQLHLYLSELLSEVKNLLIQEIESMQRNRKETSAVDSKESLKALIQTRFEEPSGHSHVGDFGIELKDMPHFPENLSNDAGVTRRAVAPRKLSLMGPYKQNKLYSYQVDDCVYDENGDFLYRIP